MLTTTRFAISQHRWLIALPVLAALLLVTTWLSRPAQSAPSVTARATADRVGTVTYDAINGAGRSRFVLNSFNWHVDLPTAVGGGGTKPVYGEPEATQVMSELSPFVMRNLIMGRHLVTVTVVLYQPGTVTPEFQWVFSEAILSHAGEVQQGPASASPVETVTWSFRKVAETSFATDGTTVAQTYCWDTAVVKQC